MAEDMAKQDDGLAIDLYNYTVTGEWWNVVEMYEEHQTRAISARINTSGDTALHVAVAIAPEDMVRKLVRVITMVSEFGLWTKNNEGNTPLHVAASTGRLNICILLAEKLDESLEVKDSLVQEFFCNNAGESPLFLAAFHGHEQTFLSSQKKKKFLCLVNLWSSPNLKLGQSNSFNRRKNGDTILHCAIRWEYFGEYIFLLNFFDKTKLWIYAYYKAKLPLIWYRENVTNGCHLFQSYILNNCVYL